MNNATNNEVHVTFYGRSNAAIRKQLDLIVSQHSATVTGHTDKGVTFGLASAKDAAGFSAAIRANSVLRNVCEASPLVFA